MMKNLLKQSIYQMYQSSPDIIDLFDQIDWTSLNTTFNQELYSRISEEDAMLAQAILDGDLLNRYDEALQSSVFAMTRHINNLLDLVTLPTNVKGN